MRKQNQLRKKLLLKKQQPKRRLSKLIWHIKKQVELKLSRVGMLRVKDLVLKYLEGSLLNPAK